ncbi:MAG: ribonuclease H-like domain-containing protein [Thermodesulfovibrionales bacterium]|nr:ribonuclease H-like domain-containing protein [Thermodesulfovibrionales bacterium]
MMIRHTFSILNGIGSSRESRLWQEGVLTWEDFLSSEAPAGISPGSKSIYDEKLVEATDRLDEGDASYFSETLARSDHWRLFDRFSEDAVCLDIETNGLPAGAGGYITVVGLYDGSQYTSFVRGRDLSAKALSDALSGCKCLVTFYGSVFDIPFMERALPGFSLDAPHFDLCFGLRKLGIRGGLKRIEGRFGIARGEDLDGMDGYGAVLLWNRAKRGNAEALDLLVRYNREDTVNLWHIARETYSMLRDSTGIMEHLQ